MDLSDLFRGVRLTGWGLANTWNDKESRKVYVREASKLLEEKVFQPMAGEKFDLADFETAIKKSGAKCCSRAISVSIRSKRR